MMLLLKMLMPLLLREELHALMRGRGVRCEPLRRGDIRGGRGRGKGRRRKLDNRIGRGRGSNSYR